MVSHEPADTFQLAPEALSRIKAQQTSLKILNIMNEFNELYDYNWAFYIYIHSLITLVLAVLRSSCAMLTKKPSIAHNGRKWQRVVHSYIQSGSKTQNNDQVILTAAWLLVPDGVVWELAELLGISWISWTASKVYKEQWKTNTEQPVSESSEWKQLCNERRQKTTDRLILADCN